MTKKQKKVLYRIIISVVLLVIIRILYEIFGVERRTPSGERINEWVVREPVWFLLYMIPYLVIGHDILKKAFKGILNRQIFDENFLMAVATVGAIAVALVEQNGDYTEAVAVMLFYQIGELFQAVAVGKSRKNITALMDIRPDYANIENENGELEQVDPDEVEIGTVIIVQPGEKVPIDGIVMSGSSTLNTSTLTGESVPRGVKEGDEIISGCINLSGLLKIQTTKEFGESTVSKILELMENSSMKKSRSENFISKFAKYYTPAVCGGALALAVLPPLFLLLSGRPAMLSTWIIRALTFLVISCPCALVISIPLSFFGGIGGASACGILVKGSNYLEAMAQAKYVVFDKTGTLTKGVFEVTKVEPSDAFRGWLEESRCKMGKADEQRDVFASEGMPASEKTLASREMSASGGTPESEGLQIHKPSVEFALLELAAYAESYSTHPISKSLKEAYLLMAERVTDMAGEQGSARGSSVCTIEQRDVKGSNICTSEQGDAKGSSIGTANEQKFANGSSVCLQPGRVTDAQEISGHGVKACVDGRTVYVGNGKLMKSLGLAYETDTGVGTVAHVAVDGIYAGYILISDVVKEGAKEAIEGLKAAGIRKAVMLTGDNKAVAESVAKELGIDEVKSELLPGDKVEAVEMLLAEKGAKEQLAFVGDGINDAPVLSRADIGIAMGALGSDAAIEAADIVLMDDNPAKIALTMKIARKCLLIVYENIVFALTVKGLCLILGAFGIANMWMAIFADVGVMVIAVLNAIRCLRVKEG